MSLHRTAKITAVSPLNLLAAGFKLSCLAAAMSASTLALAESMEAANSALEEIEVLGELTDFSATKSQTPIVETARSISIEPAQMFIDKGALNLSQASTYMAGVTGETYGFATRGDWIRSRGLEVPRYRDSIQELFGSYNASRADVYTLEQVEVLRGPASVLYGQGSPGGLVNYVSKTPKAESAHEIAVEVGNFDRKQLALDSTGTIGEQDSPWRYRVVAVYRDTDTQVDYVDENTRVIMPSITYAPSEDSEFTILGLYQKTDSDSAAQFIPIEGTLTPFDDGTKLDQDVYVGEPGFNKYNTQSQQVTFLAQHRINEHLELKATALWRDGEADYNQAWAAFTGGSRYLNNIVGAPIAASTVVPRSFYQADNTSEQYAADFRIVADFETGAIKHEILAGVQYQDVTTDNNTAYYYGGGALTGDFRYVLDLANPVYTGAPDQSVFDAIYINYPEQNIEDTGWYLSDQLSYENWRFTLGVRRDSVSNDDGTTRQDDDATSVSAGMLYHFDSGFSPYVSYAESFETVVGTNAAGQQMEPEEGRQYEAGIKYQPDEFPGLFTVAYYDIEISNLPNPNSLPSNAGQQRGISTIKGVEFEGNIRMGDVYLQMAASALDAEDPNGYELSATPKRQASSWLSWRPSDQWQGFKAGVGVRHVGESVSENAAVRYESDAYTLVDAMIGFESGDNWDVALNVRNLNDEQYLTSCLSRGDCFPGLRRSVVASLRYSF